MARLSWVLCFVIFFSSSHADSELNTDLCDPPNYWSNRIQGDPDIHALTAARSNKPYFIAVYGVNFRLPGLREHYSCLDGQGLVRPIKSLDSSRCDDRLVRFNRDAHEYATAFNRVMRHARPDLVEKCSADA